MGRGWRVTVFSYFEIRFYFLLIVAVSDPSFLLSCTSLIRVPTRFYNFAVIFISWHCIIYLDWLQFIFLSSNLKFKAPLFPFCSVRWSYGSHLPRGRKVWSAPSSSPSTLWSEVKSLSHVRLFVTLWTVAYQAPPSMGFSMWEYWSGLPFPSPGDLPHPEIEPRSPAFQADALTSEPP